MAKFLGKGLCYDDDSDGIHTSCFKGLVDSFRYRRSAGNITLPRKNQGRRYCTSDGTPDTISICSGTDEGRACTTAESESALVLENTANAKIPTPARASFYAKEMAYSSSGDPIIIFCERGGKPDKKSRELNLTKATDEMLEENALCQVCGALDLEDEKLRDAEGKEPSRDQILRGMSQTSIRNARFTRARSFPVPDSTSTGSFRLTTRRHKESEFWSFSNSGRRSMEGSPLTCYGLLKNEIKPDVVGKSSSGSVQNSDLWGWNRLIVRRFNFIKQRLKRALSLRESGSRTAFPYSSLGRFNSQEDTDQGRDGTSKFLGTESSSDCRASDCKLKKLSRTSSLNDSLEKYAQLLGNSCNTDAKLDHSRSLRLRNDEGSVCSNEQAAKIFRRRLSMSDLDSLRPLLFELDHSTAHTESIKFNRNNPKSMFDVVRVDGQKGSDTAERAEESTDSHSSSPKDSAHLLVKRYVPDNEAESILDLAISITLEEQAKFTGLESCLLDENKRSVNSPQFEGTGLNSYNSIGSSGKVKAKNDGDDPENLVRSYYKLDKKAEANFNFVRDLLELSGSSEVECNSSIQFSTDHNQLNLLMLKDSDGIPLYNLDSCNRKLLFDLVNESLVDIHGRSSTCISRNSSKDKHKILEEVWKRVCWYESLSSDLSSLDDIVAQDMKRGSDIWMNVGVEIEDVGLELEDLIFDELLDEVLELV